MNSEILTDSLPWQCTEFLQADRWGIQLKGHQYEVAAEEKGLKNRTSGEIEWDWLEAMEKDRILEHTLYWLEVGSKRFEVA
jgi:hypothetical protein